MTELHPHYSVRFNGPHIFQKGIAGSLTAPVYLDGGEVAASGATIKIYRPDGTEFSAGSVAFAVFPVRWTWLATDFDDEAVGEGWIFEWTITTSTGWEFVARNDGALVYRQLFPVLTDADLYRRHHDLDPSVAGSIAGTNADYQEYIDEAWRTINDKLIGMGRRPWLSMSPTAFRPLHLYMTLELIFRDFATSMGDGGKYYDLAVMYGDMAKDEWPKLNYLEDTDNDGKLDDARRRASAVSTIWLNGRNGRGL